MEKEREVTIFAIKIFENGKFKRIPTNTTIFYKDIELYRDICRKEFENESISFDMDEKNY